MGNYPQVMSRARCDLSKSSGLAGDISENRTIAEKQRRAMSGFDLAEMERRQKQPVYSQKIKGDTWPTMPQHFSAITVLDSSRY